MLLLLWLVVCTSTRVDSGQNVRYDAKNAAINTESTYWISSFTLTNIHARTQKRPG